MRRNKIYLRVGFILVVGFGLAVAPRHHLAQSYYFGGITGAVSDSTGAVIPHAPITVTNLGTNTSFKAITNDSGYYRAGELIPGTYSVAVRVKGFKSTLVSPVKVEVSRVTTVNIKLEVGTVSQSVQVQAVAPLLDTTTATLSNVITTQSVVEMPLNGRSFTQLIGLVPGAQAQGTSDIVAPGNNYVVAGGQQYQNNFMLDGVYNNEEFYSQFGVQPSLDSVQEFNVEMNVTSAEFGRYSGANISVATKSGTSKLHGDVYEFLRNADLDANNWWNDHTDKPKGVYRQNQFGVTAGGPIYLPHLYTRRDKAFFFANYEGLKFSQAQALTGTLPTANELLGNFSDILTTSQAKSGSQPLFDDLGRPIYVGEIENPFTTRQVTQGTVDPTTGLTATATGYVRDPFAGNIVPGTLLNSVASSYAKIWYPTAITTPGGNNYTDLLPLTLSQYLWNTRIDYNLSSNLRFFARVSDQRATSTTPSVLPDNPTYLWNTFTNMAASLTWLVSPSTVFEYRSAFNRTNLFNVNNNPGAGGAAAWLAANPLQGVPIEDASYPLYPSLCPSGYTCPNQGGNPYIENMLQQQGSLTAIRGRHELKFGFEWEHLNTLDNGIGTASFSFLQFPTSDPTNSSADGNAFAAFLLGLPYSGARDLGDTAGYMRQNNFGFYAQDNFHVTSKLTADFGLRWEYNSWPVEKFNHLADFQIDTLEWEWAGYNAVTGQAANTPYRSLMAPDWRDWAPRLGFAYQLNPKTVIRSGFGYYYTGDYYWAGQGMRGQWPYAISQDLNSTNMTLPTSPLATYFPGYTSPQPGTPPGATFIVARNNRTSYTMQWNFGVQRQLANNLLFEVRYNGLVGRHLANEQDGNDAIPGPGTVGSAADPRWYQQYAPTLGYTNLIADDETSNYNALQVKVDKRFSNGLQFLMSYAWMHELDSSGGTGFGGGYYPAQDPLDRRADYGNDTTNLPNILTGAYIYDLPVGKGKRFMAGANSITDAFLGGWELTGIFHHQTGAPYNIRVGQNTTNNGGTNVIRPNLVPGQVESATDPAGVTSGFLNLSAFSFPANYTYGNLARNTGVNPPETDFDMGLYKNFYFREDKNKVQFRAEFFNLPNEHWLGGIDAKMTDAAWGDASNASAARVIQFGLKLYW